MSSHVVRQFLKSYTNYHVFNLDALTYTGNLENLVDIETQENYPVLTGDICK